MTWEESLSWLYSTQWTGIKLGLENTRRLLEAVGNPHHNLSCLHVAGTNGKGSTCAMIDAVLREAGYRTGLYTSPHLMDFRERIRVNGKIISKDAASEILGRLKAFTADWENPPTFFELTTVLALQHFAQSGCDFVVLETGMGGRLDSTNAVTPIVSAITPIDMDHMEWLGDTIQKIAAEKAGIIKRGVPVVSSPQASGAASVLQQKAESMVSPIEFVNAPYCGQVALAGFHQKWNAALAIAAIRAAKISCEEKHVIEGLSKVSWPARFQRVGDRLIVDGAHNAHSATALVCTWREVFGDQKASIVFGAMRDKEYASMLDIFSSIASKFHFVPVDNERAADPADFAPRTQTPSQVHPDLISGVQAALAGSSLVLVAGSLFLAGEALDLLQKNASLVACDPYHIL